MRHHRWPVAYKFSSHSKFDKFPLLSSKFQHSDCYGMFTEVNSWYTLADRCSCYIFTLFSQPIFKYCSASKENYIYRCPELSPQMSWYSTLIDTLIAYLFIDRLNHWGRMTHICVSKLTIMMVFPLAGAKPLYESMLEYCQSDHCEKNQWKTNRNLYILIQENAFENVIRKLAAGCIGLNVF